MSVVSWTKEDRVAVVTMDNGENRHNPGFIQAMYDVFDEVEGDQTLASVVLCSRDEKYWSLGIDIEWITGVLSADRKQEVRDFLYALNRLSERILSFPMPVIAAIGGHAFGDGAMLALCCDFRFMKVDKGYLCFPEVDINIPFLPSMLEIIRKAVPASFMEDMILTGRRVKAPELEAHHVIRKACADEADLMRQSLAFAGTFTKARGIFAEHKKRLHRKVFDLMEKEDPAYIAPLILTA